MSATVEAPQGRIKLYWGGLGFSLALILLLALTLLLLFWHGVGMWGNNIPVTWALDIVSYDFWVGIACGALLTACALALRGGQDFVTLQTLAATLAVLAAAAAAIYPIIHLGRPWFFFWTLPYPNTFDLWPQVRSPLFWDAIDILALLGISIPFWYLGMLPALARLRHEAFSNIEEFDGPGTLKAQIYGIAAIGWRGAATHWSRWLDATRVLALCGIGVVVVLQTGAAVMFSGTLEPGWHDTLMPIEFLAEAAVAGTAILTVLATAVNIIEGSSAISARQLDACVWALLAAGTLAGYCFAVSELTAAYGGDPADALALHRRMAGPQSWSFWLLIFAALLPVHFLWIRTFRRSASARIAIGLLVAAGIWSGHYMVIVATLQHDYLPVSTHPYRTDVWEWTTFAGTVGLFLSLLLILLRLVPVSAASPAARARPDPRRRYIEPGSDAPLWGLSGEFVNAADAHAASKTLRENLGQQPDTLTPFPLQENAGLSPVLIAALGGFLAGSAAMFAVCAHAADYAYTFNIGGRPVFSWPEYIVPALSCGLLCSGFGAFLCMLVTNRLPRLNHPAFNIPGVGRAASDRFFVVLSHPHATRDIEAAERIFRTLRAPPAALHRVPR
jgi:Ni/Fe-hydrogenase subunit HybB-like protein